MRRRSLRRTLLLVLVLAAVALGLSLAWIARHGSAGSSIEERWRRAADELRDRARAFLRP